MPVNLSIKNVPDQLVEQLRQRAVQHHRSLQGELLFIIESSVKDQPTVTPQEAWRAIRQAGLRTPNESTAMIRKVRDGR